MEKNSNETVFIKLLRAGLWERNIQHFSTDGLDLKMVYQLSEEQSVVGLVAAGIEHVLDVKLPTEGVLLFVGYALQIEKQNSAMNSFIGVLVEKMRKEGIYTFLIKGQGVAQCYEKPLWRSCGDIDLYLSEDNYQKAYDYLIPLANKSKKEGDYRKHHELIIDSWIVELHGDIKNGLSNRIDRVLEDIQYDLFFNGNVRSWINKNTHVFLPGVDDDIIIVFTHIIKHLFKGGIGLRQVCDWCRLLWKYKDIIDRNLLEKRINKMGLTTEWLTFAALAVDQLGMPEDAMPFYSPSIKWKRKANRIIAFIFKTGNFGHNRDVSYQIEYNGFMRKSITLWRQVKDNLTLSVIFPVDAFRFLFNYTVIKSKKALTNQ